MTSRGTVFRDHLANLAATADEDIGLAATALTISGLDRPVAYVDDYLPHLEELAADLAALAATARDAHDRAAAMAEVMARRHCYRSDHRDDEDIANTSLMWVVDNRRGVAEALGILALDAARRLGWQADGLSFPPRFLLRLADDTGGRVIIDPLDDWRIVETPEMRALLKGATGLAAELTPAHYAALDNRDILIRLQNEAKLRLLRCGHLDRALGVVETILLFAPDRARLWREAGLMHMRLDQLPAAVAALEQFVSRTTNPQARRRTLQLLQELRGRMGR